MYVCVCTNKIVKFDLFIYLILSEYLSNTSESLLGLFGVELDYTVCLA